MSHANPEKKYSAVTLIELIIAIILFSVVAIGISSIDIFGRFHVVDADRRAKLQNEVSHVLEHITKQMLNAIGDSADRPVQICASDSIAIRIDYFADGLINTNDRWIGYAKSGSNLLFYGSYGNGIDNPCQRGASEIIANNMKTVNFDYNGPANVLDVTLTACWNPASPATCGTPDNPEVEMRTAVNMPAVSSQ